MSVEFNDGMVAQVKLDDEGVVLDIHDKWASEPVATTYKTYDEFEVEIVPFGEDKECSAMFCGLMTDNGNGTCDRCQNLSDDELRELLNIND